MSINIYAQDTTFLKIKTITNAYVSFKTRNGNVMYADWSYLPICNDFIIDENLTYYTLQRSKTNKIQSQIYVDFICVKEVEIVEQPVKKYTQKKIKSDTTIIRKVNTNKVSYPHRVGIVKYNCNYKWVIFQPKKNKKKLINKK